MSKVVAVIATLIIISGIIPAYAVQLDVRIPRDSEEIVPTFQFTRIITMQFSADSNLAELVGDVQQKVKFNINSENAGILVEKINAELYKKSFTKVTDIDGMYSAVISPQKESVSIEYKIIIRPTIQGHFISDSTLDSQWRGFEILEEIPIETKYGTYDINSPQSALIVIPQLLEYLSGSAAMRVLDLKLIDTNGLSELPLSKWESMFDPTSEMSEPEKYGFTGTVITNYSMGICTIYIGFCQDKDHTEPFEINGEKYTIRFIESQDDGTIIIDGYVQEGTIKGTEVFLITDEAPTTGGVEYTQVPIMYTMSGIGIVAAIGFFVWSDRKNRKTPTEQTGIDPKDLYATAIGSSVGSYQTNRGVAHLR